MLQSTKRSSQASALAAFLGGENWAALFPPTPFAQNAALYRGEMVINEIMFAPVSGNERDQFIELYNRGTNLLNLAGWYLSGDISFYFPEFLVPPGGYIVIGRDLEQLQQNFPHLNSSNATASFSGKLAETGGHITLSRPVFDSNSNAVLAAENEVTFGSGGAWGQWSRGGGSSLELIDSRSDNQFASNWRNSDPGKNAPWTLLVHRKLCHCASFGYATNSAVAARGR